MATSPRTLIANRRSSPREPTRRATRCVAWWRSRTATCARSRSASGSGWTSTRTTSAGTSTAPSRTTSRRRGSPPRCRPRWTTPTATSGSTASNPDGGAPRAARRRCPRPTTRCCARCGADMPAPIRVAHVIATAGRTGAEAHLLALLPSFDPAFVAPVLIAPGPGPLVDEMNARGVEVVYGAPTKKLAFGQTRMLAESWRGRFDIVHAHGPRATFWSERAARQAGVPAFVATVHELRWQTMPPGLKREAWIALEGRSLARADRVITVSHATQRDLIARWPRLAGRTRVVHATAPLLLAKSAPPQSDPGRRDGQPMRLVTVGRFEWQKGYDLLLPALARLAGRG